MVQIEETLVDMAKTKLIELRGSIANPSSDESLMRHEVLSAYIAASALCEICQVADSGLSSEAEKYLQEIGEDVTAAVRTFSWLY